MTEREEVIERLKKATAARNRAAGALMRAREELTAAIVEAKAANMKQADIVRLTGYNREHIRRIVRDALDQG